MRFETVEGTPDWDRYKLLHRYHEQKGGILFRKVNPAHVKKGSRRRQPTGIRVSDLKPGFEHLDGEIVDYTEDNRDKIRQVIQTDDHSVELIEVYSWGFNGFGRIVGKSSMMEMFWEIDSVDRTLIINNAESDSSYDPEEDRDKATQRVFDAYDIKVVNGDKL